MKGIRILAAVAVMLAGAAGAVFSQTLDASQTSTTLSLAAADYPLTVTHNYQLGSVTRTYTADGTYTESAARGLGDLVSITIFSALVPFGAIDNEVTPGSGRRALTSFTSRTEQNGAKTGVIIIDIIVQ